MLLMGSNNQKLFNKEAENHDFFLAVSIYYCRKLDMPLRFRRLIYVAEAGR